MWLFSDAGLEGTVCHLVDGLPQGRTANKGKQALC